MDTLAYLAPLWVIVAFLASTLIGMVLKHADGGNTRCPLDEEPCCDGEFCGAWDSCREKGSRSG